MKKTATFQYANLSEGQAILGRKDEYITAMAPFERSLKMNTNHLVPEKEFISFIRNAVLQWTPEEKAKMDQAIEILTEKLSKINLIFNEEIFLVKTSGEEEWNSAYTRGTAIILPERKIKSYDLLGMVKFLAHEYFHVLSKYNREFKKLMYKIIGFTVIDEIEIPTDLFNRKLTNPDAPFNDSYIEVTHKEEKIKVAPVILLKKDYKTVDDSKDIFESITLQLVIVEEKNDLWTVKYNDGKPACLSFDDITGYVEQVGRNTEFQNQPEEILAENFAILLMDEKNIPSPEIINNMKKILFKGSEL